MSQQRRYYSRSRPYPQSNINQIIANELTAIRMILERIEGRMQTIQKEILIIRESMTGIEHEEK